MRNYYFLISWLVFLSINHLSLAQLVGLKTIDNTLPTAGNNYNSFTAAILALNANGVGTGGVTFNVTAGQTFVENPPTLTITGTALNPILFKSTITGNNPKVRPSTVGTINPSAFGGLGDAVFRLEGTDYITFDGIDIQDHASAGNNTTRFEYGYWLARKNGTDGCQNVSIKNCTITLNKANRFTVGIYQSNMNLAGTPTVPTNIPGLHKDNTFNSNTINNVYAGIVLWGANIPSLYDRNNRIGNTGAGNTISDYGGGTATTYAIYAPQQTDLIIAHNNITNAAGCTGTVYGIYTSGTENATIEIANNALFLTSAATTRTLYGIRNESGDNGTNNTISIHDNTLTGFQHTGATTGDLYVLSTNATAKNVLIYNNTLNAHTYQGSGNLDGIRTEQAVGNEQIYNNTISNLNGNNSTQVNGIASLAGTGTTKQIYGNTIYQLSGATNVAGIRHANGGTVVIHKNNIYKVKSIAVSGTGIRGYGLLNASGASVKIYNNFISEIEAPLYELNNGYAGISVNGGDDVALYYNTIYLNATPVASVSGSSGVWASIQAGLDMRNNIIVNESTPGTGGGNTVAYRRSNYVLTTYHQDANHNCLYAGTPGNNRLIYTDGAYSAQTLAAYKALVSPSDRNSVTEKPPFLNIFSAPYNLRLQTATTSQCEGSAEPISGITADFDGNTRNTNTPDIGAHENALTPLDTQGPNITYIPLGNTTSTANRPLTNVKITDPSGININTGTKPRLYFKKTTDANTLVGNTSLDNGWKYVEASESSSPFSFTIDYSLLYNSGGGPGFVTLNVDEIQYFIVAQDLAPTPNVGNNSVTFANAPAQVNLSPAQFPVSGNINSYPISDGISGIVQVPSALYPSLTNDGGIFQAINNNRLVGNITIQVTDNLTNETGKHPLNQWEEAGTGNYRVTIITNTPTLKTISGNYPAGLFRLSDADRVTIDGSVSGEGRYLKFVNNSTNNGTAVLQIISMVGEEQDINLPTFDGAKDIIIQNCVFQAGNTQNNTYGIYARGKGINTANSDLGADSDNLLIENNQVYNCGFGIYVRGTDTDYLQDLQILNNEVGNENPVTSIRLRGIEVHSALNAKIIGNRVFNVIATAPNEKAMGIHLSDHTQGSLIQANQIYNIRSTNPTGSGAYGINISGTDNNHNLSVVNNIVYNIISVGGENNTANNPFGIRVVGGNGHKIYYNSVHLYGSWESITTADISAALLITNGPDGYDIRNNIFANKMSGGAGAKAYALRVATALTNSTFDYNNYYASGSNPVLAFYGTDITTLAALQAATGSDAASKTLDPRFNADNNLKLIPLSLLFNSANFGTPIAGISLDIVGNPRTSPIRGAYEVGGDYEPPIITYPLLANTTSTANRVLTDWATITDNATGIDIAPGSRPRLYYKKSTDANAFIGNTSVDNGWKWVEASDATSPFDFTIDYSLLLGGAVTTGDQIQYFVTAQDLVANVAINSGIQNTKPTSVDYISSNFPISGNINSYFIGNMLSGTITIPSADFPSLTNDGGLFDKINNGILAGNLTAFITANLAAETGKHSLRATGMNGYGLTIRPSSTTERLIVCTTADTLIGIVGASKVKIDGSYNGIGRYLRFVNGAAAFPTIVFCNGASNDTLMNCTIEGANTSLVNSGVLQFGTSTPPNGVRRILVSNNIIRDWSSGTGMPNYLFLSYGSVNAKNEDNTFSDNQFFNFTNSAFFVGSGDRNGGKWKILRNQFFNPIGGANAQNVIEFIAGNGSNENIIADNTIGGTAAGANGSAWNNTATATISGMFLTLGTNANSTISGNTIRNIQLTGTGNTIFYGIRVNEGQYTLQNNIINTISINSNANGAAFYGISASGTQAIVQDNTIGDAGTANSIVIAGNTTHHGILAQTTQSIQILANTVANIKHERPTAATGQMLRGITFNGTGNLNIEQNIVTDLQSNSTRSITTNTAVNDAALVGILINSTSTNQSIHRNHITKLSSTAISANTAVVGIGLTNNLGSGTVTANRIHTLSQSSSGTPVIAGIFVDNGNWTVANNQVALTNAPNTFYDVSIRGIWDNGNSPTNLRCYHNTIYIAGSQSNGSLNSHAFLRSGNSVNYLKNNIFLNARTGVGTHYALGKTQTDALGWQNNCSDYNLLVAPLTNSIAEIGTTAHSFVSWKTNAFPGGAVDASSWSVPTGNTAIVNLNPTNLFVSPTTGDLNIRTNMTDSWFVNGKGIAGIEAGLIGTDFNGNGRNLIYGYGVDIGAHEFTPTINPHSLTATPTAGNVNTFTFAGRTLASIGWGNTGTMPTNITVRYYSGTTPPNPYPANAGFMDAYWEATPIGGSGYNYTMKLFYDDALMGSVNNEANLIMAKKDGSNPWQSFADGPVDLPLTLNTITKTGLTNFSLFTGIDLSEPLAVDGLSLAGQWTASGNELTVNTTYELNTAMCLLERSVDGIHFSTLNEKIAAGYSIQPQSYTFTDNTMLSQQQTLYYRARIVDIDGSHSYSNIIALSPLVSKEISFKVYPNPTTDYLNIELQGLTTAQCVLYDAFGKAVIQTKLPANQNSIDIQNLAAGIYFLGILTENQATIWQKVIINK